jgi:hypothetical protein
MAKKAKPRTYISRSSGKRELDRAFYDRFDPHFLFYRALTLYAITKESDQFSKALDSFGSQAEVKPYIDARYFGALRADLHFLEAHQFEAFFALMLAVFQPKPHWVYLTEYKTEEIKAAVDQFIAGDFNTLTSGTVVTDRDFVTCTIYHGQQPSDAVSNWETNLDNHAWLLRRMAERYRAAGEYNAYKHGVRIIAGPASWTLSDDENHPLLHHQSDDSITYLDIRDVGEGGLTLREVTKQFNPKESFFYLQQMHLMLETMVNLRRGCLSDDAVDVRGHVIIDLDKDDVVALGSRNATLTVTV